MALYNIYDSDSGGTKLEQAEIKGHSGVILNWCGISFIIFWALIGACMGAYAARSMELPLRFIFIFLTCTAFEFAAAKIASVATEWIRAYVNNLVAGDTPEKVSS